MASMIHVSPRQREVLHWAACGKTADETAGILGISKMTVKRHRELAGYALHAVNLTHAVAKALTAGVLTPGDVA